MKSTTENATPDPRRQTATFNLLELIPEHFERFFAFFREGHQNGIVPARVKELARLKVAAINDCDT